MSQDTAKDRLPLIRLLFDLLRLRGGPEQAPHSPPMLVGLLLAYGAVGVLVAQQLPQQGASPLLTTAFAIAFSFAWLWLMLQLAGKPSRLVQTAIAAFGVQLLLTPFIALLQMRLLQSLQGGELPALLALALVVAAVYVIAVMARILRAATEWPMPACVLVLIGQSMVEGLLAIALFAPQAATAGAAAVGGA
ncbi:MAG: hypothetical protein RL026_2079 [Pseudomonadota bacterium]|jgi:hypothetical protein